MPSSAVPKTAHVMLIVRHASNALKTIDEPVIVCAAVKTFVAPCFHVQLC